MTAHEGILGVKLVPGLAGIIGGCLALSFVQGLTKPQAVVTVLAGGAVGTYGQPMISYYLATPQGLDGGIGFFLGVIGMGLIAWLVKAADDPIALLEKIRGIRK